MRTLLSSTLSSHTEMAATSVGAAATATATAADTSSFSSRPLIRRDATALRIRRCRGAARVVVAALLVSSSSSAAAAAALIAAFAPCTITTSAAAAIKSRPSRSRRTSPPPPPPPPSSSSSLALSPLFDLPLSTSLPSLSSSSETLSLFWKTVDPDTARGQFWFFFGAGTGAGGIGLGQVPKIYKELSYIRSLANNISPTETEGKKKNNGLSISNNPLIALFYSPTPNSLTKSDVKKVLKSVPNANVITKEGTAKETSYLAQKGYVARSDFTSRLVQKNKCSPLASYAVFDAISKGSASVVSPNVLDERMSAYRTALANSNNDNDGNGDNELDMFVSDLATAAATRVAAYSALAFLLFIVFDLIAESGYNAFF